MNGILNGWVLVAMGIAVLCGSARAEFPQFVTRNYIELQYIERISRFCSAVGHD